MKLATWTDLWAGVRSDGTVVVWLVVSAVHLVVDFSFFFIASYLAVTPSGSSWKCKRAILDSSYAD